MDKLIKTASTLDIIFKILSIMLKIAFVACLVCVGIVLVGNLFDLPAEMIGSVDQVLDIGSLRLHVAEGYMPEPAGVLNWAAIMCALGAVMCFVTRLCVKTIRAILAPMKAGKPFASEISKNLQKLGWLSLIASVVVQALSAVGFLTMAAMNHIDQLLISEKITHVDVNVDIDLSVLIIPAVFFLLAYVFRYGEELQTLSDETV